MVTTEAAAGCWKAGSVMLQERDSVIDKLRSSMQELSLKCEAATAQAQAAQPYERRYRDLQARPSHSHTAACCVPTPHLQHGSGPMSHGVHACGVCHRPAGAGSRNQTLFVPQHCRKPTLTQSCVPVHGCMSSWGFSAVQPAPQCTRLRCPCSSVHVLVVVDSTP